MFEFLTTDPMSPITQWLDKELAARIEDGYQLSLDGENKQKPSKVHLRLLAPGYATNLSMRNVHPSLLRAHKLQLGGIKVINPPLAHYITDDKLICAAVCRSAGLAVPLVWDAHHPDGELIEAPHGWIVKPRWGELGKDVCLFEDLDQALQSAQNMEEPQVLQHFVPNSRCVRLVASQEKIYSAYEKWMPDENLVAAICLGGERREVEPSLCNMDVLACRAVAACGADFAGVDILLSEGVAYLLELNINPGGLQQMSPQSREDFLADLLKM